MDPHNPIIAETYVKREPAWKMALYAVAFVLLVLASVWATTVVLFSLER